LGGRLKAADQEGVGRVGVRADQVRVDRLDPNQLSGVRLTAAQRIVGGPEGGEGRDTEQKGHDYAQRGQDPQPPRRPGHGAPDEGSGLVEPT